MFSEEIKKEIDRTGYIYRLEFKDGIVKVDSSVSNSQIPYILKIFNNIKSIHCVDAVTGALVDYWDCE